MEIEFKCNINPQKITNKVQSNKTFWNTAHLEWWRLMQPYTPFQTGALMNNVTITEKGIKYKSPYAHKMYDGTGINFRSDKHRLASAHWDKAAKPSQLPKLAQTLNNYIKSGRFEF